MLFALLPVLAGCRTGTTLAWQSAVGHEHPLVGRIWDVAGERFIDETTLVAPLVDARYVLLGEKHDNADHHALQARLLGALTAAGRRPAVALEMLTPSQSAALDRHLAMRPRDAAGIGDAVDWTASGWPPWPTYQPIAEAALEAGLPIVAANFDAEQSRAISRQGVAALGDAFVRRHGLDRAPPNDVRSAMGAEIREAHCGHAPEDRLDAMIDVQRARDARMAEALLGAPGGDGVVLIAGAGHARTDHGVPAYVRRIEPGARIVSLAFVEVDRARADARSYARRASGAAPFDYLWFTPAVDDVDPCEKFRRSLERLRR